MYKKIAIAGATAAVIVGAGTAALATTGDSSSTTGTPASTSASSSSSSSSGAGRFAKRHPRIAAIIAHHGVHGTIVTTDGKGNYTTHDGILGTVSAVAPTSITIKSSDGFVQTYVVNSATKIRERTDPKASTLTISSVHVGDHVGVVGTGAPAKPTATFVIEGMS